MRNAAPATEVAMNSCLINLGHIRSRIGDKALTSITKQDVDNPLASIGAELGIGNTTLHKTCAISKRVFVYAVNNDWLVRKPCDRITVQRIDEVTNPLALGREMRVFPCMS